MEELGQGFHQFCRQEPHGILSFSVGNNASAHELPLNLSQLKLFPYIVSSKGFLNLMGVLVRNWNVVSGWGKVMCPIN